MEATDLIHGRCNCGKITVSLPRASLPPKLSLCHCNNCRASSGSLFLVNLRVPTKDVTISGDPKIYTSKVDSGNISKRRFCGDCGSPVMANSGENPETSALHGGLFVTSGLDLPPIGRHVYWERAEKWEVAEEGVEIID